MCDVCGVQLPQRQPGKWSAAEQPLHCQPGKLKVVSGPHSERLSLVGARTHQSDHRNTSPGGSCNGVGFGCVEKEEARARRGGVEDADLQQSMLHCCAAVPPRAAQAWLVQRTRAPTRHSHVARFASCPHPVHTMWVPPTTPGG
eukprot:366056-Chlamydomonas_euryale.AAC.11